MPLAKRGKMNETLLEILRLNVREPVQVEGDLYSLAACNETGSERLLDMMAEFELDSLDVLAETVIENSRQAMLEEIRALPFGTYENAMRIDGFEKDIDLVAKMTIGEDGIDIDFSGTSPVSSYGINVPLTYTQAYASFGVRCVVGSRVPNNAGSLAPVRVTAPEGSILNAPRPCAVTARHVIGQMLPDVVLGCLYQANSAAVPAEGTSCLWVLTLLGGHGIAGDAEYGAARPFTMSMFHTGGTGARPGKDGLNATAFPSGVRNTPIEISETVAPIVIWRKEYRGDSGGPGRYRGGTGQIMEIGHAGDSPFAIAAMFDRVKHPPRGRGGGGDGQCGRVHLGSGTALASKGRQTVPAGDRLVLEMPGGGGLGDALSRPPEAVAWDVRNGFVSRAAALKDYGVIVGDDGSFEESAARRQAGGG
jgi:N-methylhydantoinase B